MAEAANRLDLSGKSLRDRDGRCQNAADFRHRVAIDSQRKLHYWVSGL